eukprot:2631451-Rhodomonas_salina.1
MATCWLNHRGAEGRNSTLPLLNFVPSGTQTVLCSTDGGRTLRCKRYEAPLFPSRERVSNGRGTGRNPDELVWVWPGLRKRQVARMHSSQRSLARVVRSQVGQSRRSRLVSPGAVGTWVYRRRYPGTRVPGYPWYQ